MRTIPLNLLKEKLQNATSDPQLLLVIFFAFFTNGMMSTMLGSLLPFMMAEYKMSYALGGMVLSAHQIGNQAAVFIAGFLPYLLGRKKSTISLGAGILVGMLLMSVTGNPLLMLIAFAATGIGRGTMSNIANVVVSEITVNKTSSLNLLHATFAVGALLAPFLTILFTGPMRLDWRSAAWLVAAAGLLMLVVFGRSSLSDTPSPKVAAEGGKSFVRSPRFWLVTAILFAYLCTEATIMGWLITYFKDSGIMGGTLAQSTSSVLWMMMLAGRLLCAAFSYKVDKHKLLVVMSAAIAGFYLLMISTRDIRIIFPTLMGLGISMAGLYPTSLSCMDPSHTSSTAAVGTCISLASLGSVLMPMVVGAIAQHTDIAGGMAAISVALVILFLLTVVNFIFSRKAD